MAGFEDSAADHSRRGGRDRQIAAEAFSALRACPRLPGRLAGSVERRPQLLRDPARFEFVSRGSHVDRIGEIVLPVGVHCSRSIRPTE